MLTYELRLDFPDGYDIVAVQARTIGQAQDVALRDNPDAYGVKFLGTIDPATPLALAFLAA